MEEEENQEMLSDKSVHKETKKFSDYLVMTSPSPSSEKAKKLEKSFILLKTCYRGNLNICICYK